LSAASLRISTTWKDLLFQPLSHFVTKLERALVMARMGSTTPFSKLLEDPDQLPALLDGCLLYFKDIDETSDVSESESMFSDEESLDSRRSFP